MTDANQGAEAAKPSALEAQIAQFEKEAEAEEAALATGQPAEAGAEQPVEGADAQTDGDPKPDQPDGAAGDQIMIPKARLDQVLSRLNESEAKRLKLEGKLEATQEFAAAPKGADAKAQPEAEEFTLADIDAARDLAAKEYEEGKVSFSDYQKVTRQLERMEREMTAPPPAPPPDPKSDLTVIERTQQIEAQNPWLTEVRKSVIQAYAQDAIDELKEQGVTLKQDAASTLVLRAKTVELMRKDGYGQAAPAEDPKTPQPKGGVTPEQRAAKVDLAAKVPPNTGATHRSPARALDDVAKRIDTMSVEELSRLKPEELERLTT